jgi:CDP-diacylglycerol--glycerol-3-phosphate 3-phosphatidyltransferase
MGRGGLPNLITLARIVLSPFFILFFSLRGEWFFAAFAVGLLFEITDFLDGAIARHRNLVTGFGKLFDPLADSISRFTVFLCLLWAGYANLFAVAIIFYRDALVASVRTIAAYENVIVSARLSGKLKAVVQSVGITAVLILILVNRNDIHANPQHREVAHYIIWTVAVITAASGVDYIKANWPLIKRFADR